MGHSSMNMDDISAESKVNYGSTAYEVSVEKNISKRPRLLALFNKEHACFLSLS